MLAPLTVFLGGDVMTGRGIDQILPCPGDPRLRERYIRDARTYVELAESVNGPIPRPVHPIWPWGDALSTLDTVAPDVRLVNLETSITARGEADEDKGVHYRMHPANMPCLVAARLDVCALAGNHVLDFGRQGLADTLGSLVDAGISTAGAGATAELARQPAIFAVDGAHRVIVFSLGTRSSGIARSWCARGSRAGVDLLPDLSAATARVVIARVRQVKRPGDVVVASIHWGSNWATRFPRDTSGLPTRSSTVAWTSCTGTPRTIHARSSSTAAS